MGRRVGGVQVVGAGGAWVGTAVTPGMGTAIGGVVGCLAGHASGKGAFGKRLRAGRDFDWKSTRDAREAIPEIFESPAFPWSLQGQVVVLSTPGTPLMLDDRHLDVITRPELFATLQALGATGVLLPGVDGDVAALYTFASNDMPILTRVLFALAEESGADCVSLTEAEFLRPGASSN